MAMVLVGRQGKKRRRNGGANGARARGRKRRFFKAGRDRVGGYYGRYRLRPGLSQEKKFFDTAFGWVALDIAGGQIVQNSFNLIPAGVTESQRIGRKCTIVSISFRLRITWGAQLTDPEENSVRVILYVDHQANGATAVPAQLLEIFAYDSYRNLENISRFTVLYDRFYDMISSGAGSGLDEFSPTVIWMQYHKKCNIPIEFSGVTGNLGEVKSNNIGMLVVPKFDNTGGGVTTQGGSGRCRVRFTDS